jgi:hypothetical protein
VQDEDAREERVERKPASSKDKKSRSSFFGLLRTVLALMSVALVLSLQPFALRPRAPGSNKVKAAPIPMLLAGAAHFGAKAGLSPARVNANLDLAGRALLFPNKYYTLSKDKRAPAADKGFGPAWRKTKAALGSVIESTDRALATHTLVFAGSALCVLGAFGAVLVSGLELLSLGGALVFFNASRVSGLEAQPELYVLAVLAALMLTCTEMGSAPATKRKPKARKAHEDD